MATQAIPSPEIVIFDGAAHAGARWQLTPLLYSFGVHRRTAPFRAFVVEPFVRQSGSVEVYASPEYLAIGKREIERLTWRFGTRAYFPLVSHGEYLSMSLGTSYSSFGRGGVGYELGVYVLFGFIGLQATLQPTRDAPAFIGTFNVRFF
jgi:hypothetical protein